MKSIEALRKGAEAHLQHPEYWKEFSDVPWDAETSIAILQSDLQNSLLALARLAEERDKMVESLGKSRAEGREELRSEVEGKVQQINFLPGDPNGSIISKVLALLQSPKSVPTVPEWFKDWWEEWAGPNVTREQAYAAYIKYTAFKNAPGGQAKVDADGADGQLKNIEDAIGTALRGIPYLLDLIEDLGKAVEFYARPENWKHRIQELGPTHHQVLWDTSPAAQDHGKLASRVLARLPISFPSEAP